MALIGYVPNSLIKPENRIPDTDNILRIHGVHSEIARLHYDLYLELMRSPGPLARDQREMIAVIVSRINGCHY